LAFSALPLISSRFMEGPPRRVERHPPVGATSLPLFVARHGDHFGKDSKALRRGM
jgi:hypothetical protein